MRASLFSCVLLLAFASASPAADVPPTDSLRWFIGEEGVTYDPRVPEPETFFGFPIGDWHLEHHQVLAYFRALAAAAPDRVRLEETGLTHGRRTKILLTIASPANLARLDAIREAQVQNALGAKPATADAPTVVWLGYTIHGNEPSGVQASPIVAYHLAAGRGPAVDSILEHAVVLIDPLLNPDGSDRFAAWSNNHRGALPNPDREHREHVEPWPSGRTNYYWLDLNRDWMPAVMPESRIHVATFQRWRPSVFGDFHEMGTQETYFFQPGIPEMVNPLSPPGNQELTQAIATHHADALDAIGSLYFTGERFDDFYVGKGSTYPDILGSVGILFEQASARGHSQESPNGVVTLRFATRNQVRTSFSTLRGAVEQRTRLHAHQFQAARSAVREAATAPEKAWIAAAPGDPARLARFAEWLSLHGIEARTLATKLDAAGHAFEPGRAVVVPAAQPAGRLVRALFEKRTTFRSNAFYDVSAWNMAEAYGLVWTALDTMPSAGSLAPAGNLPDATAPAFVSAEEDTVAIAFSWSHHFAPRAAHRFLAAGARVRVSMRPFTAPTTDGDVPMPAGTIVVPYGSQTISRNAIDTIAAEIAAEDFVPVLQLRTGLTPHGIDVGSQSMPLLPPARIGLIVGEDANIYHAGEVWHLLDRDIRIPVSLVEGGRVNPSRISGYTALVFSDGRFQPSDALKAWVEAGGTLVVTGGAIRGLADAKWIPLTLGKAEFTRERVPFADAREDAATRLIAGSIVEATVDLTHPIAFGLPRERIALMRNRDVFVTPGTNHFSSPARYTEQPLVSGYIGEPNLKALAGSAAVQIHHLRAGRIIVLPDAPAFRSHWIGSAKLLLNAIHFGPFMREAGASTDE
jgi:hypothetical protein